MSFALLSSLTHSRSVSNPSLRGSYRRYSHCCQFSIDPIYLADARGTAAWADHLDFSCWRSARVFSRDGGHLLTWKALLFIQLIECLEVLLIIIQWNIKLWRALPFALRTISQTLTTKV